MGRKRDSDALTRWWRGISLRAKITGVTVMVLALGLLSAGLGAVPFLHSAFITQIDDGLRQSSTDDLAAQLFSVEVGANGSAVVSPKQTVGGSNPPYAALYKPDGSFGTTGGRTDYAEGPKFRETLRADQALLSTEAYTLPSADGNKDGYRAITRLWEVTVGGNTYLLPLVVAAPTAAVDKNIATYLAIFLSLAALTLVVGALLTRWAVTLAFRRLGQVESTAMAIAAGNFTQRMPDAEPHTEVGRLKLAINTMLGRLDAALNQRDASVSQMRRFVGDASHELRTPLVTVRGYAELYRMGAIRGEEDTAQAMDRIEKEAIRMGNLVEDLLALARLDERREVVFSAVDLRPIARDAALDVRATAPERVVTYVDTTTEHATEMPDIADTDDADIETTAPRRRATGTSALSLAGATLGRLRRRPRTGPGDVSAATPPTSTAAFTPTALTTTPPPRELPIVLGEEDKIRQVVANLLGNARRYTADDSPIEIAVGVDDTSEHGWIAVMDHGDGIPPQQREQIFQRFWRADTSRARETGGSGLGLAIVASIVQSLHGSIAVEETPGGGATFRVSLPLAHQRTPEEHLQIATQPIQRLQLDADGNPLSPDAS